MGRGLMGVASCFGMTDLHQQSPTEAGWAGPTSDKRVQASLERVGLDASKAVARARSRSVSRVGRKRLRDAPAGSAEAMDMDGSQAPEQKRIHSAKSRRAPLLPALHPYKRKLHHGHASVR